MKAVLDHIGIAVRNIDEALAFYRDALGLHVEVPEEVASQRVRAHFIPVGGAALELLEATAPDSAIAKYVETRGPGIHHLTLRVEDLAGALDMLAARGVRLVDRSPRPGAEGALVAFIHPSAAHGVLVELKQTAVSHADLSVQRLAWGDLALTLLHDGPFKLDGGAMFGVVPRVMWERKTPPDDRNRIQLAMRPLLVEADWGRMLIDCGAGDKMTAKEQDIYGLDRSHALGAALNQAGLSIESIDYALATHLHFDHFGGATRYANEGGAMINEGGPQGPPLRDGLRDGRRGAALAPPTTSAIVPTFPRARHLIRAAEWEDATHPHERNRASYLQHDFVPLHDAGVIDFYDGDQTIMPGVRVVRTGGHTGQHQIVFVESSGKTAVFVADLIPTVAHIQDPWIMGYDLFPVETLQFKKRFIREAIDREYLIIFEHDPHVAAGYIREHDGKRSVEKVL